MKHYTFYFPQYLEPEHEIGHFVKHHQIMKKKKLRLTSFWRSDCYHLIGLVQLGETLREHLDFVGGVRSQDCKFVAGFVTVSVHDDPQ